MVEQARIAVVGSHAPGIFVRVKRVPVAGETVIGWDFHEPVDGGKGSNQAIAAARLGGKVCFIGCVGRDRIGDEGSAWMKDAGVDVTWLKRHEQVASGVGFILLDEEGIPAMVTSMGANAEIAREDVCLALDNMDNVKVLLTQFEVPPPVALASARIAKERGIVSIVNPAPAPEGPVHGLDAADILVPNETEAKTLLQLPQDDPCEPSELAQRLCKQTMAGCVLVTLGEKGVACADQSGETWCIQPPLVHVLDTSGAGDAFCAALAVAIAEGQTIRAASKWAVLVSSLTVTKPGTIPAYPKREEVNEFQKKLDWK